LNPSPDFQPKDILEQWDILKVILRASVDQTEARRVALGVDTDEVGRREGC
jgi:hypothetical protein